VEERLSSIPILPEISFMSRWLDTFGPLAALRGGDEINRLKWDDVSLREQYVVLYTHKKKGGHLTPRKVPMTQKLFEVLSRRHTERDPSKPWVFWHSYWNNKSGERLEGPYKNRRKALRTLCKKAGVNTPVSMHFVTLGHLSWKAAMFPWAIFKRSWAMRTDQQPRFTCILWGILSVGPLKPMNKPGKILTQTLTQTPWLHEELAVND